MRSIIKTVIIKKVLSNSIFVAFYCILCLFLLFLAADIVTFQDFSAKSTTSYLILSVMLFAGGAITHRYFAFPLIFYIYAGASLPSRLLLHVWSSYRRIYGRCTIDNQRDGSIRMAYMG